MENNYVFNPTPAQLEIINSTKRFRVLSSGRRFGKTTLAINEMLAFAAFKPHSLVVYVAPTVTQARDISWRILKNTAPNYGRIKNINETRLELKINDSEIWLRGTENVESLRGLGIHFLIVDEVAMMRNWYTIWEEVLRSTLTDTQGQVLFCSTPRGYNHHFELWQKGQGGHVDWQSWTFATADNPHIKKDEIVKAQEELTPEAFQQEYLAQFRTAVGLAHPVFDRNRHVIEYFDIPREWQRARGFDFGSTHPTASVRVAVFSRAIGDPVYFLEKSYKLPNRTLLEHTQAIQSQDYGLGFIPIYGDPSGGQLFTEYAQHGVNIQSANRETGTSSKNWVEFCVEKINQLLKPVAGNTINLPNGTVLTDAPHFFILKTTDNEKLIYEFENLSWKSTKEGSLSPTLDENMDREGHFDLLAALRYLMVSFVPQNIIDRQMYGENYEYINQPTKKSFRIGS